VDTLEPPHSFLRTPSCVKPGSHHAHGSPFARFLAGKIILDFKPLKMDLIEGSETSANINQTLGIHPKIETVKGKIILHSLLQKYATSA
jgi:hypothetical protein